LMGGTSIGGTIGVRRELAYEGLHRKGFVC